MFEVFDNKKEGVGVDYRVGGWIVLKWGDKHFNMQAQN